MVAPARSIRRIAVAAALVVLGAAGEILGATTFTFSIPAGWKDLAAGVPAEGLRGVTAEGLLDAQTGKFAAHAMDVAHADDGFGECLKAIVRPGSQAMDAVVLGEAVAALVGPDGTQVLEQGLARIEGVDVGRVVYDRTMGGRTRRMLTYFLPGKGEHAILTYEATPGTFAAYLPVFEASAARTRGLARLEAPVRASELGRSPALWGALAGAVAVAALGAVVARRRRPGRPR